MSGTDSVVFLLDDNGSVRETIRYLLESADVRVETFANAEEFFQRRSSDGPASLMFDVRLPGMSDPDALRALQRPGRPLPTRKLPRQVDTAKLDSTGASGLGRNVSGGTWPRLSWGRSVL